MQNSIAIDEGGGVKSKEGIYGQVLATSSFCTQDKATTKKAFFPRQLSRHVSEMLREYHVQQETSGGM